MKYSGFIKKTIATAMFALLTFSSFSAYATTTSFSDIQYGYDATVAIEYLKAKNVIQGYSDGTFKPTSGINRAELVKIMVAGQGIVPEAGTTYTSNCLSDVKAGEWYEPYICYAYQKGWVSGYSDKTFKPGNQVNRAEAAKIIINSLSFKSTEKTYSTTIKDVTTSDWYYSFADTLIRSGIENNDYNKFYPSDLMTRSATASYIFRMKSLQATALDYYSFMVRQAFLTQENMYYLEDFAYGSSSSGSSDPIDDLDLTFQSYGDLTFDNDSSTDLNLNGYTLELNDGTVVMYLNFTVPANSDVDVEASDLFAYPGEDLNLYDASGNFVSAYYGVL